MTDLDATNTVHAISHHLLLSQSVMSYPNIHLQLIIIRTVNNTYFMASVDKSTKYHIQQQESLIQNNFQSTLYLSDLQ